MTRAAQEVCCVLVLDLSGLLWTNQGWLFRRAPVARTFCPVFLGQGRYPSCHGPSQRAWGWYWNPQRRGEGYPTVTSGLLVISNAPKRT